MRSTSSRCAGLSSCNPRDGLVVSALGSHSVHVAATSADPSATIVAVQQVPLRDVRNFTARVLERVKAGEVLEITERGRPVARLVPIELDHWGQLEALGLVEPRAEEGDPLDVEPVDPVPGVPLPSAILARLRAGER